MAHKPPLNKFNVIIYKLLFFILENITLNITIFKNQTLSVEIFPGLTIANLKERIHDLIGMPVKNQRLMVKTHQLSDLKTIKSYNLNKNTVIELIPNFRNTMVSINIINENINLNLDTSPDCKIKYIKNFIQFKLNIKISKQVFIFQGQTLDDNSNLSKYGLINMSHIYLKVLP